MRVLHFILASVIPVTVYADMLFFVNFIMNACVLWVLAKVIRIPRKFRWILLGAAVMALLYTLVIIVYALQLVNVLIASGLILSVGIAVTFHPRGVKPFLKLAGAAYGISFMMGGLGMALFFLTNMQLWQLTLVGTGISYVFIKTGLKFYESRML